MRTTTISAAEMRIDERLNRLADEEHWDITPRLLARIIRESGRAANQGRPVDIQQPERAATTRVTRLAALQRDATPSTVAVGECHLGSCTDSPTGWRLYVHEGWQPVCTRHMGAVRALARVFNRDLQSPETVSGPVVTPARPPAPPEAAPAPVAASAPEIGPQTATEADLPMAVLRLVVAGLTNQQIADQLGIELEQGRHQVRLWMRSSRTSTRTALADWAQRTGILGGAGQ